MNLGFLNIFRNDYKKLKLRIEKHQVFSKSLKQTMDFDVYAPISNGEIPRSLPILLFNDAQDMQAVRLVETTEQLLQKRKIRKALIVAIYPKNRMQEYGTISTADYAGRGSLAKAYADFIIIELLPFIKEKYEVNLKSKRNTFAGFSLGGLSALDLVWHHSDIFKRVGVFSGALWWRSDKFREKTPDADRIIHDTFLISKKRKGLKFWLQTGTNDETSDRNNNGVIDAIDDTLDLIKILKLLGYPNKDIKYIEVEGGEHYPKTWAEVLPDFLVWVSK